MANTFLDYGVNDTGGGWYPTTQPFGFGGIAGNLLYMFFGGYVGLTWMKNVFMMTRDFWDSSLGTPYSGQLYPTGGNSGGPGQVYPF